MADYYKGDLHVLNTAIYRIKVKGIVSRHVYFKFQDHIVSLEYDLGNEATTVITCLINDQVEYKMIINSLYKAHLPIFEIDLL